MFHVLARANLLLQAKFLDELEEDICISRAESNRKSKIALSSCKKKVACARNLLPLLVPKGSFYTGKFGSVRSSAVPLCV